MIETVFFGINLILIYAAWSFCLKRSILDHFRDKLFDLREEVREFYIKNNIPLSDKTYKNMRDLINSHLRFTESKSLVKVAVFSYEMEHHPEVRNWMQQQIEMKFSTSNKELGEFLQESRTRAKHILLMYMLFSSPTMMMLFSVFYVIAIAVDIKDFCIDAFSKNLEKYSANHFGQNGHITV